MLQLLISCERVVWFLLPPLGHKLSSLSLTFSLSTLSLSLSVYLSLLFAFPFFLLLFFVSRHRSPIPFCAAFHFFFSIHILFPSLTVYLKIFLTVLLRPCSFELLTLDKHFLTQLSQLLTKIIFNFYRSITFISG